MAEIFNNPLNLEAGQNYAGETGDTYAKDRTEDRKAFVVFDNPITGIRAGFRDIRSKMTEFDGNIDKMIFKFSPPEIKKCENNKDCIASEELATKNYQKAIRKAMGGNKVTEDTLMEMLKAMLKHENGYDKKYIDYYLNDDPLIIKEAYELSFYNVPDKISYKELKNLEETGDIEKYRDIDIITEEGGGELSVEPEAVEPELTLEEAAEPEEDLDIRDPFSKPIISGAAAVPLEGEQVEEEEGEMPLQEIMKQLKENGTNDEILNEIALFFSASLEENAMIPDEKTDEDEIMHLSDEELKKDLDLTRWDDKGRYHSFKYWENKDKKQVPYRVEDKK